MAVGRILVAGIYVFDWEREGGVLVQQVVSDGRHWDGYGRYDPRTQRRKISIQTFRTAG
jgi:hypothetical protein